MDGHDEPLGSLWKLVQCERTKKTLIVAREGSFNEATKNIVLLEQRSYLVHRSGASYNAVQNMNKSEEVHNPGAVL